MILSDRDILGYLRGGSLLISPFVGGRLQPASYDVRLADTLCQLSFGPPGAFCDPDDPPETVAIPAGREGFVLMPGAFVLGSTMETVQIPVDLVGRIEGRSSLGRLGLIVHATAGYLDPGFRGQVTLELFNAGGRPFILRTGMGIAQIAFEELSSPAERPYGHPGLGSRYQGQCGPTAARPPRTKEVV